MRLERGQLVLSVPEARDIYHFLTVVEAIRGAQLSSANYAQAWFGQDLARETLAAELKACQGRARRMSELMLEAGLLDGKVSWAPRDA